MSLLKKALLSGVGRVFSLPRLSIPLILTLGLTLGAVLSVIAISSTLLYQPLQGVKNEGHLQTFEFRLKVAENLSVSYWNMNRLASFRERFADLGEWAAIITKDQDVIINDTTYPTTAYNASNNILDVLGADLLLGDDVTMASPAKYVWISESLWQSSYGGVKSVLGKQLKANNQNFVIAGVIEDVMAIPSNQAILNQQIWFISDLNEVKVQPDDISRINGEMDYLIVKSTSVNVTLPNLVQTEEWLTDYLKQNAESDDQQGFLDIIGNMSKEVIADNYRSHMLGDTKYLIMALLAAVVGLLLMATLNLLNIFIAHYQGRAKEFAIQLSLGSSLLKVRALVLLENLPSFLLAALTGLLVAAWALRSLPLIAGDSLPMIDAIGINSFTIISSIVIILLISLLFSALALVDVDKHALANNLNSSGKGLQSQSKQGLSRMLMVLQLSVASVLLTASVMISLQSYQAVYRDLGYELGNAYDVSIDIADDEYITQLRDWENYKNSEVKSVLASISKLIESQVVDSHVVIPDAAPLSDNLRISAFQDVENNGPRVVYQAKALSADFFSAFNITFLAGANLTQTQIDNDENRVVIDENMANTMYPDLNYADIIGKTIPLNNTDISPPSIVTGIVENTISRTGLTEQLSFPVVYSHRINADSGLDFTVMMPEGKSLSAEMIDIKGQFPRLNNVQVKSLHDIWLEQTLNQRVSLWVVLAMTALTLFLAAIGVAGLTQMTTNHRKYELAVRMATGAKQMRLIRFILKDALWMLVLGLGVGFIVAVLSYQQLAQELDMLPSFNWVAMSLLDLGLVLIVILSVVVPAWRVIRADPMQALRQE